jgi:hypothetical protein
MRLGWLFAICLSPELDGHFNGAEALCASDGSYRQTCRQCNGQASMRPRRHSPWIARCSRASSASCRTSSFNEAEAQAPRMGNKPDRLLIFNWEVLQ